MLKRKNMKKIMKRVKLVKMKKRNRLKQDNPIKYITLLYPIIILIKHVSFQLHVSPIQLLIIRNVAHLDNLFI